MLGNWTGREEITMTWFVVLALLVVVFAAAWLMDRRRKPSRDPSTGQRLNPSDARGEMDMRDLMGESHRRALRKDPGSPNR